MHVKRRRLLPNFETCSVALFASLALCGPLPSRAQTATRPTPSVTSSPSVAPLRGGNPTAQLGAAQLNAPIPPNRWTPGELKAAFRKTDVNGDGQLSREEAATSPGMARRFDQIDGNKDGSISSAEFDEALK
jgi:hypothetical protein